MMRRVLLLGVLLFLTGCSAAQTMKANEIMAAQYVGRPADAFFLKFGPPTEKYVMDSGDTMYLWAEDATIYSTGGGIMSSSQSVSRTSVVQAGAGTIAVQCEVRIVASPDGKIRQIIAQNDTIGKWQLSRCNELFSES